LINIYKILHQNQYIGHKFILLGDYNINWNSSSSEKTHLEQSFMSAGLLQQVNGISYISHLGRESLLDQNYVKIICWSKNMMALQSGLQESGFGCHQQSHQH
jgi:hypothetical protein